MANFRYLPTDERRFKCRGLCYRKPLQQGGIRGRTEATGRGAIGIREAVNVKADMDALGLSLV